MIMKIMLQKRGRTKENNTEEKYNQKKIRQIIGRKTKRRDQERKGKEC